MKPPHALLALLAVVASPARAQTMLDQEERLIQIHSLLLDLPSLDAPGAYRPGEMSLGLELVTIPPIDGTTGSKRQITASDRTPVFPRPRLSIGLPAPEGFRAFAGASYIPPIAIQEVTSHYVGAEGGMAYLSGALRVGLRLHLLYADSRSPVTDPRTRDTLRTFAFGAGLSAGYQFLVGPGSFTPYAGIGATRLRGDFRVQSDGARLSSRYTALCLNAGLRVLLFDHWVGVAELDLYPDRLLHPNIRVAYQLDWGAAR